MKKIIISSIIVCSGISFSISAAQPVENYRELSVLNQIATQQAEQTQLLKDIKQELQNMNSSSTPFSDEQVSKSQDNATGSDLDKLNDQIQQNIKEKEDNLRDYQSKHAEDKFKA